MDLFHNFDKSAKRKEGFHNFQVFTNVKELKILKHCKMHWLSLEKAVQHVLQQWTALHGYFDLQCRSAASLQASVSDSYRSQYHTRVPNASVSKRTRAMPCPHASQNSQAQNSRILASTRKRTGQYSQSYVRVQWSLIITATYGPNISGCYIEVAALQRCKCIESHHLGLG